MTRCRANGRHAATPSAPATLNAKAPPTAVRRDRLMPVEEAGGGPCFCPEGVSASAACPTPSATRRKPTLVMVSNRTMPPPRSARTWRNREMTRLIALSPTTWPSQQVSIRSSRDKTRPSAAPNATSTRIIRGSSVALRDPADMRRVGGSMSSAPSRKACALLRSCDARRAEGRGRISMEVSVAPWVHQRRPHHYYLKRDGRGISV